MELNDIRSAVTLFGFLLFLGLVAWTWSKRRQPAHDEAAALPFQDNEGDLR